jgi:ribose transport system ATP-binding protein
MQPALTITGLSKTFPGQVALNGVDLTVEAGEVHALLGQNGSGKSTLVKILAGYHQPDPGAHAAVSGRPFTLGDAAAAREAGLRFVHQDLGLVDAASVLENLALGCGYATGFGRRIRWREQRRRAREAVERLGLRVDVRRAVGELDAADRTGVAIARALIGWEEEGASLLVLDEPTAALPVGEVHRLFEVVGRLRERGIAVLFVSHHLDEVFAVAQRATILRDGHHVTTTAVADLDHAGLVELIVGHGVAAGRAAREPQPGMPVLLEVERLAGDRLRGLSFKVAQSEVVGIAGLRGSGREEVAGLLAGRPRRGTVRLGGAMVPAGDPRRATQAGLFLVSGDRQAYGIVSEMSVRENLTLSGLGRFMRGWLRRAPERREAREWVERLNVVAAGTEANIMTLSGGNQQKVLIARALRVEPRLLLLDDPTKGVDVGAKDEIHALIDDVTARGTAVVIASTDAEELVRLCHRVLVLKQGVLSEVLEGRHQLTDQEIERAQMAA